MEMINREQVFVAHANKIMCVFGMPGFKKRYRRLWIVIYKAMGFWAHLQTEKQKEKFNAQLDHMSDKVEKFYEETIEKFSGELLQKNAQLKDLAAGGLTMVKHIKDMEVEIAELKKRNDVAVHAFGMIQGQFIRTYNREGQREIEIKDICKNTLAVIK